MCIYSEEAKKKNQIGSTAQPVKVLLTKDMRSAQRGNGAEFFKWGIELEMADHHTYKMRAAGQSEMRQMLSTLNVHCISGGNLEEKSKVKKSKAVIRSGYLYKKSLKTGVVRMQKAWQRRYFVLEVTTDAGASPNTMEHTAKLMCYEKADVKEGGAELPLSETQNVKGGTGKTKGTEHRITLVTKEREFELGIEDQNVAAAWVADLKEWMGPPRVEMLDDNGEPAGDKVKKSGWMEARIIEYKPDEISDEELARSNTIQQSAGSSLMRTFTLSKPKQVEAKPAPVQKEESKEDDDDDDESDEDEEEEFSWVWIAWMFDNTLRQYTDETMKEEVARLRLGVNVSAGFLEDPPDTYEHAFSVKVPSEPNSWILCPDSEEQSDEWIAELTANRKV